MPCYHPLQAYKTAAGEVVFYESARHDIVRSLSLPCGQCVGCRLERSCQWAVRCMHEASLYKRNCFLTLTYNDENLPKDLSLHYDHFQKFMKRFRKAHKGYEPSSNLRYSGTTVYHFILLVTNTASVIFFEQYLYWWYIDHLTSCHVFHGCHFVWNYTKI